MSKHYIERIPAIVKIAYEQGCDMSTALAMYINEGGDKAPASEEQAAEQLFFAYIKGKKFDAEGNEVK